MQLLKIIPDPLTLSLFYNTFVVIRLILYICCTPISISLLYNVPPSFRTSDQTEGIGLSL
jgi:hypothetical protein